VPAISEPVEETPEQETAPEPVQVQETPVAAEKPALSRPPQTQTTKSLESRKGAMLAIVAAVTFICGWGMGYFMARPTSPPAMAYRPQDNEPMNPESKSQATITAYPNPVPSGPGKGSTTITWVSGDKSGGEVYVSINGKPELLFAGNSPKGSQVATWIGKGEYEFRLYAGKEHRKVLAQVIVTRKKE
jgi:hypothetical protein